MTDIATIPLSNGGVTVIDASDLALVCGKTWRVGNRGYVVGAGPRGSEIYTLSIHRVIMGAGPGEAVDHIDRDKLNNRRSNLRFCDKETNAYNAKKKRVNGGPSSQFKGVEWIRDRWRARIRFKKQRIHLGMFTSEVDAARAYDAAARRYFGEFARPNFPEGPHSPEQKHSNRPVENSFPTNQEKTNG